MSGRADFPNNWQEVHDADSEDFGSCTFEEFQEMMSLWHLPSSIVCVMRVENKDTGKIKEYTYRKVSAATNKMEKLVEDPANVITIMDDTTIHHLMNPTYES